MKNEISISLTPEARNHIANAINLLNDNLPINLVHLTNEERRAIPKMGDKTVPFVTKALEYAKQNPSIVPPYLDVALFEIDVEAAILLSNILKQLSQIVEKLDDSFMLSGTEAYEASLLFYHSVRGAAKADVPGTKNIYEDLRKRFPRRKKRDEEAPEE